MRERAALNMLLVILAAAPLVLAIVDFVLVQGNNSLRSEVNQRQHLLNEGAQLARINQALIRQMAVAAVKNRDSKLRELLSQNGVTINVSPAPATGDGKGG